MSTRLNTKLEAEAAEYLVVGNLLLAGIPAYKANTGTAGYDLVAVNPARNTSASIQVKSRWATSASGFIIKNIQCDFVVVTKLNRGKKGGGGKMLPPQFYVLPVNIVKKVPKKGWGKISFKSIPSFDSYADRWELIGEFLAKRGG